MLIKKGPSIATRVLALLLIIIVGFASGSSLTLIYARHHHKIAGVDYPHNPAAYYSPTTVDYADSPSEFALRDLAANGGNVIDYTRLVKSKLEYANLPPWLNHLLQKLGIKIGKYKKTSQEQQDIFTMDLNDAQQRMHNDTVQDFFNLKEFGSHSEDGYYKPNIGKQIMAVDVNYDMADRGIAQANENSAAYLEIANRALEAAHNASGEREVQDAQQQLKVIEAVQNANLAEYMRIKSRVEEAGDRLEGALQDANLAAIKSSNQLVLDPSDPEDKKQIESMAEMTGIKPYESIGMPDFK